MKGLVPGGFSDLIHSNYSNEKKYFGFRNINARKVIMSIFYKHKINGEIDFFFLFASEHESLSWHSFNRIIVNIF